MVHGTKKEEAFLKMRMEKEIKAKSQILRRQMVEKQRTSAVALTKL